jgi:serine/threonine-protein kinase
MISFFSKKKYPSKALIDGYKVIKLIGEGRFGICYLVELNAKKYVLKEIKPKVIKKSGNKIIFEQQILSSINSPYVPKLVDTIKNNNIYAYILEYKNGNTIEDMIFGQGYRFKKHEIYKLGIKLIDIIKYLHQKNIVHRDIRVPNVLIDGENVYLIDFGLARIINNQKYRASDDFIYFGHLLLHLYYSSFTKTNKKSRPWYEELELSSSELKFLKKLLGLDKEYENIYDLERDFLKLDLINK